MLKKLASLCDAYLLSIFVKQKDRVDSSQFGKIRYPTNNKIENKQY